MDDHQEGEWAPHTHCPLVGVDFKLWLAAADTLVDCTVLQELVAVCYWATQNPKNRTKPRISKVDAWILFQNKEKTSNITRKLNACSFSIFFISWFRDSIGAKSLRRTCCTYWFEKDSEFSAERRPRPIWAPCNQTSATLLHATQMSTVLRSCASAAVPSTALSTTSHGCPTGKCDYQAPAEQKHLNRLL